MRENRQVSDVMVGAQSLCKNVKNPEGGQLDILSDVTLEIKAGETVAIAGASGSGKSTLLGLLAGLDTPSSGNVTLNGQSLGDLDEDQRAALRAKTTGFVFQSFHLLPSLTALENVMLPLELTGSKTSRITAEQWLERVGLADRMTHYPTNLSGGEQQRVAIARAFVASPKLMFADEPTGNLDQKTGTRISDLLFSMNREQGTTLILVTHDLTLARRCDRILTLKGGRMEDII